MMDQKEGPTVVIAMDGTQKSDEAFQWYMDNLHRPNNRLVLAHAMESPAVPTRDPWDAQHASQKSKADELRTKYTEKFNQLKITGKFIVDVEKPGEFIIDVSKKENATYVVIGMRGTGRIKRTIMGSVSDHIIHHSHCPVLVCRNHHHHQHHHHHHHKKDEGAN